MGFITENLPRFDKVAFGAVSGVEPVEDEFLDENGAMYATSELNENSELWSE